uniref:START domain-containing protein n=1 Tax=Catharus ustulatus TaxID=91951 RepID=A0A8C3TWH8_CATUS
MSRGGEMVYIPDDSDFSSFRDQCESLEGWHCRYNKAGVTVWSQGQEESCTVQKIKTRISCKDVPAETLYDVLHDTSYRKKWDSNMIETYDIGRLTVNADVGYYSWKCPSPLKNRDFVTLRSWLPLGNDYMIINYSVKHPVSPGLPPALAELAHPWQGWAGSEVPALSPAEIPAPEGFRESRVPADRLPDQGERGRCLHPLLPDAGGSSRVAAEVGGEPRVAVCGTEGHEEDLQSRAQVPGVEAPARPRVQALGVPRAEHSAQRQPGRALRAARGFPGKHRRDRAARGAPEHQRPRGLRALLGRILSSSPRLGTRGHSWGFGSLLPQSHICSPSSLTSLPGQAAGICVPGAGKRQDGHSLCPWRCPCRRQSWQWVLQERLRWAPGYGSTTVKPSKTQKWGVSEGPAQVLQQHKVCDEPIWPEVQFC